MMWSTYWKSFGAFLAMGGYGFYVWGSYAVVAVGLALEIALLIARRRRALRMLQAMYEPENK